MTQYEKEVLYNRNWSEWRRFPNPDLCQYLIAPIGYGVYQLRNARTGEYVLFGMGKCLSARMSSLSPKGQGTRNNSDKVNYIKNHLDDIEYRTIPFTNKKDTQEFEMFVKQKEKHIFNT